MKLDIDYSIYLVTDRDLMSASSLEIAVEQAILGGVTLVQLREKLSDSSEFYAQALAIKKICDSYNVPLIINDRIDIALAVNADGVHIGQSDIPTAVARRIIGNDKILGVSATNLNEALAAKKDGADYLGVGAMFMTDTKSNAKIVSKHELKQIVAEVHLPTVIIGGMNEKTIQQFSDIDIDGVAVVSAIIAKENITLAAETIKNIFWTDRRPILRGIKGAIFDLDGTVLDSMSVWAKLDIEFLHKRGLDVPSDYIDNICALSLKESAEYTIKHFNLNEKVDDILAEWHDMIKVHYSEKVKLYPHALEYIQALKRQGIKLAVATGLSKDLYEPCLKANEIYELFDVLLSVDVVGKGKDSDAIYRHAIDKLGLKAEECIIFEDVLPAIISAKKTGAKVYALREKFSLKQEAQIKSLADGYINDFRQAPILK